MLLLCCFDLSAQAVTRVTHLHDDGRVQSEREIAILQLALEKTRGEYGPYELISAPAEQTQSREFESIRQNRMENFVRSFGYDHERAQGKEFAVVRFPIFLGLFSYRICFLSDNNEAKIAKAASEGLASLKHFNHGQGVGWIDSKILAHNGFEVREVRKYESLFRMAALERVDLFCRGAIELLDEWKQFGDIEHLSYDKSFALYYALPIVFHTNIKNKALAQRIEKGLLSAYSDGDFMKVWNHYFKDSVTHASLDKRKIFKLDNPFIDDSEAKLEQYFYRPQSLAAP